MEWIPQTAQLGMWVREKMKEQRMELGHPGKGRVSGMPGHDVFTHVCVLYST